MKITEHDSSPNGGVAYEVTAGAWVVLVIHEPSGDWWASDYYGKVYDSSDYQEAIDLCKQSEASFGYYGVEDVVIRLTSQAAQRVAVATRYYADIINDENLPCRMADMQTALDHARRGCECSHCYKNTHDLSEVYATVRELLSLPVIVRYNLMRALGA